MIWLTVLFLGLFEEPVFYRSKTVPHTELIRTDQTFTISDDKGKSVSVTLLQHNKNRRIYWYRRLFTEVCLTGECRPIDIGIYWSDNGKYAGFEVFRENLTKTDHSDFSDFDYRKLESILSNEWSPLREFEFEELVEDKPAGTDATTGATKKVIADAAVQDAVYTTYTMWHLIHVGEGEQLALLTYQYLADHRDVLHATLETDDPVYYSFLIEGMAAGRLPVSDKLATVILRSLGNADAALKNTAFKAIALLPINGAEIQNQIAGVYASWSIQDKTRFLRSMNQLERLYEPLYKAMAADLSESNPWFITALLPVLGKSTAQTKEVISQVRDLERSSQPAIADAARKFLAETGKIGSK